MIPPQLSFSSRGRRAPKEIEQQMVGAGLNALVQEPGWNAGPSHHAQPEKHSKQQCPRRHPSRRKHISLSSSAASLFKPSSLLILAFVTLSLFCGTATAAGAHGDRRRSAPARLAPRGELLVDRSQPPGSLPRMNLLPRESDNASPSGTAGSSKTQSTKTKTSTTGQASSTSSTGNAASTSLPIPEPFDTSLGSNMTTSCLAFFNNFLSNMTFTSCHPFSLLLQNSNAFFQASKSFVRITQTLDATCQAPFDQCIPVMGSYAQQIRLDNNCASDYNNGNPMVVQAYNGFVAYQPLYLAGCQKDNSGSYCYADAITNVTSIADVYPYYLPLGVALPGGSRQTCSLCLQDTMAIYDRFASNASQPISKTYEAAAKQINIACGPNYINETVAVANGAAVHVGASGGITSSFAVVVTLLAFFLWWS